MAPTAVGTLEHSVPARGTGGEMLRVGGLTKVYTTQTGERVEALPGVTVSLADGEFVSVVGPSGCGKTTLLKILAGIVPPTAGEVRLRGEVVTGPQDGFGVVFQAPVLLPWLRVLDNVLIPVRVLGLDVAAHRERARDLLRMVGLGDFERVYPYELSGGMQQRVAIVRGLIHDPGVLLMDEPFGALDALTRERMNIELQRVWLASRKTVFFITHSISESVFLSDRVLVMSARPGRIVREYQIPFPRPRSFDITGTAEFGAYARDIRALLVEEGGG